MAFYKKQDHIQIIAEILCSCKSHWLELVEDHYGQKKFAITEKGLVFFGKVL
jgi:predicted transcriptional regulator